MKKQMEHIQRLCTCTAWACRVPLASSVWAGHISDKNIFKCFVAEREPVKVLFGVLEGHK